MLNLYFFYVQNCHSVFMFRFVFFTPRPYLKEKPVTKKHAEDKQKTVSWIHLCPRSNKPVLSVNFVKLRFMHHLKDE